MTFGNYIQAQSNPNTLQPEEELQFAKFLVNYTVDAAFWLGPDARFLYVNDVACRLLGYSRKELLSLTMHDVDTDFPAEVCSKQWRSLKQQGSLRFESRHRTKKGRIFPVEITLTYVEYHGREFSCAFARDITKRKTEKPAGRRSIFPSSSQLAEVFNFIEANYHQPIGLCDVAQAVGYCPTYLTDLVRRQTGQTVHRWIVFAPDGRSALLASRD